MTRVLVVWEDVYCESLGAVLKRVVRANAPAPDAELPIVLRHTARSNGGFDRYARSTWPAVRAAGLPADPRPIDHLVCVVDGDHLHDLLPSAIPRPPTPIDDVAHGTRTPNARGSSTSARSAIPKVHRSPRSTGSFSDGQRSRYCSRATISRPWSSTSA